MGEINKRVKHYSMFSYTTPSGNAIQNLIDQIWATYDVNKNGVLDKEEIKKLVRETLTNLGSGNELSQGTFDEVFANFDKDGSGKVEKLEMVPFIKQVLGGNSIDYVS